MVSMLSVTISIVASVMVLSIHNNGKLHNEVPNFLKKIFFASHWKYIFSRHHVIDPKFERINGFKTDIGETYDNCQNRTRKRYSLEVQRLIQYYNSTEMQQSVSELILISKFIEKSRKNKNVIHQWILLAVIIDRILLIAFLIYSILAWLASNIINYTSIIHI